MYTDLITRLKNGPSVLFLGQNYLAKENGVLDFFLARIIKHYNFIASDYDAIFEINKNERDAFCVWASSLKREITLPERLEGIQSLPWATIYTTAIDSFLPHVFENEWREVRPIYNNNDKLTDIRNKRELHLCYLFGSVSQIDDAKSPPKSKLEKSKRKRTALDRIGQLPSIVTNRGALIIDGYSNSDWLTIDDIYPTLSSFGENQVFVFGVSDALKDNDSFRDLVDNNIVVCFEESFNYVLNKLKEDYGFFWEVDDAIKSTSKRIKLGGKYIEVPIHQYSSIVRVATLIHDGLFESSSDNLSFEGFISDSRSIPKWLGYEMGYAFKRDFYPILKTLVDKRLSGLDTRDAPIILYGQSSSGKTITLGQLAYENYIEGTPTIFIPRGKNIDYGVLDAFCFWLESKGATNVLIVNDSNNLESHYPLVRFLRSRGRKSIVVGSSYLNSNSDTNKMHVEAPITLSRIEKNMLGDKLKLYHSGVDVKSILNTQNDSNLLSLLWRYVLPTRTYISEGLKDESYYASEAINKYILENSTRDENITDLQHLLRSIGLSSHDFNSNEPSEYKDNIVDEELENVDDFIKYVMIVSQFGLEMPYELLLRVVGSDIFNAKIFNKVIENKSNILLWKETETGDIFLTSRNDLEAKIIVRNIGGTHKQLSYIKNIIENISSSNADMNLAIELLKKIGPNSGTQEFFSYSGPSKLIEAYYEIVNSLSMISSLKNPRLVLQKASYLREIVKRQEGESTLGFDTYDLLDKAETDIRDVLNDLENEKRNPIYSALYGELAAILGTRIKQLCKQGKEAMAISLYGETIITINKAIEVGTNLKYPLDILKWITLELYDRAKDETFIFDLQSNVLNLFDLAETVGVYDSDDKIEIESLLLQLSDKFGNSELSEKSFKYLEDRGSTNGYYIRAMNILKGASKIGEQNSKTGMYDIIDNKSHLLWMKTYDYLFTHEEVIENDFKCINLLFKSWWYKMVKHPFIFNERSTLPFSKKDWETCYQYIKYLLNCDKYNIATYQFIKAICEFHLQIDGYTSTLDILQSITDNNGIGSARIKSWYYASENGRPKEYDATITDLPDMKRNFNQKGKLYIEDGLRKEFPFQVSDFKREGIDIVKNKRIKVLLAFNYRGILPKPLSDYEKK